MDILKELFGTSDELQINKSLFGSEVGHGDINLDQSHALSRENIQRPLPVLPPLRPPPNPPPLPLLPVEPRPHNPPLVRRHSLDNVHSSGGASEEKDLLGSYRSDSQSTYTQFNANTTTAHVDLHSVPQEMPMYLLQEDEGNDEEIMRLMCASREASSRGDSPSDSGSGDDVTIVDTQVDGVVGVDGVLAGEHCPSSVQDSTLEVCDRNLAYAISNPIGLVVTTEDVNHRLANEFQLLVNTATNEATIGDEDVNDTAGLVDDVISEIDMDKLDSGISSLLGLTATSTVTQTACTSLGRSSDAIHVPGTASGDAEGIISGKSASNGITATTVSAGSLFQLHLASGISGQGLHDSARTPGASRSFTLESFPAAREPSIGRALNTSHNSETTRESLDTARSVSMPPSSRYKHPASTKTLKSKRKMVNEGTQTTTGVHLQRKKTLASGHGSRRRVDARLASTVSDNRAQCSLVRSPTSEKQWTEATKQHSSTHSNPPAAMSQKPSTGDPQGDPRRETDGSPGDDAQHLTAVTTRVKSSPVLVSSAAESSDSLMPPSVNANSTVSSPATPILTSSIAAPIFATSPSVPILSSSLAAPIFASSPSVPILTSSLAAPIFASSPVAPILTCSPATPIVTSSPSAPTLTSSPAAPILTSNPLAPTLTSSPEAPALQSTPPVEPLMSTLPSLDSLLQRTLLTLSSTSTQPASSSLSASSIPTSTASAQLTTSVANSARLQLARSLLNLSIPTIIPLSVSGSSEPAVAVPLPRSLVSLACMSQRSPNASEAQHGRPSLEILATSASFDTQHIALAESRNTVGQEVKCGVVEPLTVLEDVPLGLSSLADSPAVSASSKQHYTNTSLPTTAPVSPANTHSIDTRASHLAVLEENYAAAFTAEKNQRAAFTEVRPTPQEMQIPQVEKERESAGKETLAVVTSASLDIPNSLEVVNTRTSPVLQQELATPLQIESEPYPPKCSTPACVTTPNGMTLLSRHEEQSNRIEFELRPNQTASLLLPSTSQGGQDSGSSNTKLMISSAFSLQFPIVDQRSNQLSSRILGLAATPVEVVHLPSHQCSTSEAQDEDSHRKKKRRHGGGWPKGKRRKVDDEPKPPKPPATGYRLFLSDKWSEVQRETGYQSTPHLSKKLGHMWSALRKEEKESYCVRANLDRKRYLEELKFYLENINEENLTIHESLDTFLSQSFENETDDNVLVCRLCELTFTSLHNKRCHYSSKAHTETLWQELNTLLGRNKGKQKNGKTARKSKVRNSAAAPTEEVRRPQHECRAPGDVSLDVSDEPQRDSVTLVDIDCSEVEVGMCDEAADNTTGDSGGVGRVSAQGDVDGRVDMSESEPMCIQNALVSDGVTVETTAVAVASEVVCTSLPVMAGSPPPCSSAAPSSPVCMDTCASTLPVPINTSLPIRAVSSENCVRSVDGGSVVRDNASALHSSRNVLLEHCENVSTHFKEFASQTTSNMQALYEQRRLHGELLNEYSTLQQQCEELEHFSSCYEEELGHHSLEGSNLCQQLANLLPLFKCTGDTMLVAKLENVCALTNETDSL